MLFTKKDEEMLNSRAKFTSSGGSRAVDDFLVWVVGGVVVIVL